MDTWFISLYNSELYNSSLLLAEHFYRKSKTPISYKFVILNLYKLKYYNKVVDLLGNVVLCDYDIRMVYYKSLVMLDKIQTNNLPYNNLEYEELSRENILNLNSIELFWEALTKKDVVKKKLLIESYERDTMNLECLYYLYKDELCSEEEFNLLISKNVYSDVIYNIFNDLQIIASNRNLMFHPFYSFLLSKKYFYEKNKNELFNLSHESFRLYTNCVFSHISLAIYFMLIEDFEESKKILLKCIDFTKTSGHVFLYLGVCYSKLRECEKSISCFYFSNKILMCTWKSFFYLASEYQRMSNFEKAGFYYLEGLNVERNITLHEGYVSLLIFCEDYKKALSYISSVLRSQKSYKLDNILFLKCYCHLFLGQMDKSVESLEKCTKDYRYFCTKGYIKHLTNNLDDACNLYNKSLLLKYDSLIEDLMASALKNTTENDVYNLCTEIFEYSCISDRNVIVL